MVKGENLVFMCYFSTLFAGGLCYLLLILAGYRFCRWLYEEKTELTSEKFFCIC